MTTTPDEGYIKFQAAYEKTEPFSAAELAKLMQYRQACYALGLIGTYSDGIGYGNISQRINDTDSFYISGSATGHFAELEEVHFARVTQIDIDRNTVYCDGPIVASSESMSHAVLYQHSSSINAVIHIHHLGLWEMLMHRVPTTPASAPYGSPEMAMAIIGLLEQSSLKEERIFVMEGHREGVFVFGNTLAEAFDHLRGWYEKWKRSVGKKRG